MDGMDEMDKMDNVRMKIAALALAILATLTMHALHLQSGSNWYNGAVIYQAERQASGNLHMFATDEGEELEFVLAPVANMADTYRVAPGPHDYTNLYEGMTVKHQNDDGLEVLCFYNDKGLLHTVMTLNDGLISNQELNISQWMELIRGTYTTQDGTQVIIDTEQANVGNVLVGIKPITFNGYVTGLVALEETGKILTGNMEVEQTVEGLRLYEVEIDESTGHWNRVPGEKGLLLTECDPQEGRFFVANNVLFHHNELYNYDRQLLRLMRNSILAHHHYAFKSRDLQEYFGKEPWYSPGDNNDEIELSVIEKLNIALIQCLEATPEGD